MRILENVPLKQHTTLRVGGPARYFIECLTDQEIVDAVRFATDRGLAFHILGGGSNTIFPDRGYDGVVVKIKTNSIQKIYENGSRSLFRVSAGCEFDRFVQMTVDEGLAGIECLSGIPGSAGAAPVQNIGAYGQEIGNLVERVHCIDRSDLTERTIETVDCGFSYRESAFKHRFRDRLIIRAVDLRLSAEREVEIRYEELKREIEGNPGPVGVADVREAVLRLRRRKSMVLDPADPESVSAGSFFTNPSLNEERLADLKRAIERAGISKDRLPVFAVLGGFRVSAAFLIESAGFHRGFERDGAGISRNHSLAIVNRGCGAKEILELSEEIEDKVFKLFGMRLAREPVYVES